MLVLIIAALTSFAFYPQCGRWKGVGEMVLVDGSPILRGLFPSMVPSASTQRLKLPNLAGKSFVVVLGDPGDVGYALGSSTSLQLAQSNASVILACGDNNKTRCSQLARQIGREANRGVMQFCIDLGSFESVEEFATKILSRGAGLDGIVLTLGQPSDILTRVNEQTVDGFEKTYQANHLSAHFILVRRLLPLLESTAQEKGSATITSLTSPLHLAFGPRRRPLLSQEEEETEEGALVAFARANEANVAFMQSLHKRVATRGVLCNSVNPGLVTGNVIAPLSSGGDDFELGLSLLGGWGGVDALLKLLVNKFWPRIFPSLWSTELAAAGVAFAAAGGDVRGRRISGGIIFPLGRETAMPRRFLDSPFLDAQWQISATDLTTKRLLPIVGKSSEMRERSS
jgi:NAD(P)-dependent dehydrogenase (short-subunit alcohol dehydrogenase family)